MVARTRSVAFSGVRTLPVEVQASLAPGLPAFTVVGLGDKAVAESRERVRAAFEASGLRMPSKRIVVNLAPADLAKEGSHFDLPIALALLAAMGVIESERVAGLVGIGELALDGALAPVAGVLPAAFAARDEKRLFICPAAQAGEAEVAAGLRFAAAASLAELVSALSAGAGEGSFVTAEGRPLEAALKNGQGGRSGLGGPGGAVGAGEGARDLLEVKGQQRARRALELAAAGGHNLLFIGPPGAGKSMLAECLPGILPPLGSEEALALSVIHSLAGALPPAGLVSRRPFRSPHHSASLVALAGGGARARPGEVSLAHHGVLFLDELPEFSRAALETLRQPMEAGRITVARAAAHETYPARFQLVAAMNPCRCGQFGRPSRECGRAPRCVRDYQARISGPVLDRIDMQLDVEAVPAATLAGLGQGESSGSVARRVRAARAVQARRAERAAQAGRPLAVPLNSVLEGAALEEACRLDEPARRLLLQAAEKHQLSARAWNRALKLARTVADLRVAEEGLAKAGGEGEAGAEEGPFAGEEAPVRTTDLGEALFLRGDFSLQGQGA